jgi:hypothetical protein
VGVGNEMFLKLRNYFNLFKLCEVSQVKCGLVAMINVLCCALMADKSVLSQILQYEFNYHRITCRLCKVN